MITHSTLKILALGAAWMVMSPTLQAQDTVIVPCDGDTVIGTYCYTNNDQHAWYWQSACGAPVTVHFISGTIEGNGNDYVEFYDGEEASAPLLYQNGAAPGDQDLTGLIIVAPSGRMYMEMTSNATNCCATDGFANRDAGWQWNWTVTSGGTAGIAGERRPSFAMYPNPAKDDVQLQMPAGMNGSGEVRILDVAGRVVHIESLSAVVSGRITIGLDGLRSGLYQVVLATTDGIQARPLQVIAM